MKFNYKKLLELQSLEEYSPIEQLDVLKILFDFSLDSKNIDGIELGLKLSENIDIEVLSGHEIILFHYFVANGWATKRLLKEESDQDLWNFQMEEIRNEIFHLRKSISYPDFNSIDELRKCQIYTNLGNLLNSIGRFAEAQQIWDIALKITPKSSLTLANKATGLFSYSKYLYDSFHKNIFVFYSYQYCKKAVAEFDENVVSISRKQVTDFYLSLENGIHNELRDYQPHLNEFPLGDDLLLKEYRLWSLKNQLYINPLNDLGEFSIASHDCLNLPTVFTEFDKPPSWINLFNQIKQEFGTSRFLYYESLIVKSPHIADTDIVIVETYQNIQYSYSLENAKICFRVCYSILDKIAFLLNDYLNLNIPAHKVDFKSLWFIKKGNSELRDFFTKSDNKALRGLYWLSKDIYEKEINFNNVMEPDSKEIDIIRNHIEHKSLNIVSEYSDTIFTYDERKDISYTITRVEFEKKVLKLLKLVRSAIIYLSLAVYKEETTKERSKDSVLPIQMQEVPHSKKR